MKHTVLTFQWCLHRDIYKRSNYHKMIKPILTPFKQQSFCLNLWCTYNHIQSLLSLYFSFFFFLPRRSDPASHKENTSQFRLQSHFKHEEKAKGRGATGGGGVGCGEQGTYNHQAGFTITIIFSVIYQHESLRNILNPLPT